MFSKTAIFAISALATFAQGELTSSFAGCSPTYPACPPDFVQTAGCECCPVEGSECDAKYNGQFCIGTGTTAKLDPYRLPLSCPARQKLQSSCTNTCASFLIRQDSCDCCPAPMMECDASFTNTYCDNNKNLILTAFPSSCPQRQQQTATCTVTCTTAPDTFTSQSCQCCPDPTVKCGTSQDAAFLAKYCNSDKSFNFANLHPTCPQNFDPSLKTAPTSCPVEFCLDGLYRPAFTCDCCPYSGSECKFGDLFCTNNVVDKAKVPATCVGSKDLPALCSTTFCPPDYVVGKNCDCCPIKGAECTSTYGGQFCDAAGKVLLSSIPDGCPSKDTFNTCTVTGSSTPLTCPDNHFRTPGCDCCPVEGRECDPVYNGAYCTNDVVDRTKITGKSCPQNKDHKDCSLSPCPSADYIQTPECDCCPQFGFECDYDKYGAQFCDYEGVLLKQNIPMTCPQQKKEVIPCTPERYVAQGMLVGTSLNKYVNTQCEICPVAGKECEADTEQDFCIAIRGTKIPDFARIPASCPQASALTECDTSLYTKNANGQCCPLKGKETNAEYKGRFATPEGQIIYNNIPAGCPQFEPKTGCTECVEGTYSPAGATNCECCPFPGFECDPRYGGKYCDLKDNLIMDALPAICLASQICDDRYFWVGSDDFTCCPFEGKECSAVYSNKYCPLDLATGKLGDVLDPNTIPAECKAPPKAAHTCSSAYEPVNGACCPIKNYECSVLYQFEQFCTGEQIDYSKIDYKCPQFQDICQSTDFRAVLDTNNNNAFKACCPKMSTATGQPTDADACKPEYGYIQGVTGGLFCTKEGAVTDDVKAVCNVPAAPPSAGATCGALEEHAATDPNVCCPKPGFECVGDNKAKYCTADLPDDNKPNWNAACANKPSALVTANNNNNPAAHKYYVKDGASFAQCPIIGSECDGAKYAYTSDKNDYCDRVADAVDGTKYTYTLRIMSIPPVCPQRIAGFSLAPPTHFSVQNNAFCPDPVAGLTFGAHYSTWANSAFTFDANLIAPCKNLNAVPCTAAGQKEVALKTGSTTQGEECVYCPEKYENAADPVYNNKYVKDGQPVAGALKEQCKKPNPQNTNPVFKCPAAVTCGNGWVASTYTCQCCPDFTKYTDDWCAAETTASELSNLLCASIGANATKRAVLDASQIPASCTVSDETNFPHLAAIDERARDGTSCPLVGTECDAKRPAGQANYCASDYSIYTGEIKKLQPGNIPASCPQKKEAGVCDINACEQNYITIVDPQYPTDASQCQCCPVINKECNDVYNGRFCQDGKILYDNIPSGCPQHDPSQSCNVEFFDKTSTGSCCPKEGMDCVPEFKNFFCDFDGGFNKNNYVNTKCSVPACKSTCTGYYIANGCDCCPFPGFALDEVYFGAYDGFDGEANVPKECQSLNLFPFNAWQKMSQFTANDYASPQTVDGLPPVGTLALGVAKYGSPENLFNQHGKPIATIKQLEAIGANPKINWITKGAVFGIEALNHLYSILSNPALQTTIDAQVAAMAATGYVATPSNIFTSMGVADAAAFAALDAVDKRFRLMTFWYLKPLSAASKFGHQDRFLLGETNWIAATPFDHTVEYTLSQTVAALNDPHMSLYNAKNVLATTAALTDKSIANFLKQDRFIQTYRLVKNSLPATMDDAWHTANRPAITTAANEINTNDKLIEYSVYWYDQKYPGLTKEVSAVNGDTAPVNAARAAVYDAFVGACITASIKANSIENTFTQYRMDALMEQAIKTHKASNPLWDELSPPVKYSAAKQAEYAAGMEAFLDNGVLNKVIGMAIEMESWPTKYALALPANPTIASLWAENVLGGILAEIGVVSTNIVTSVTNANTQITEKNALFKVAFQLFNTGRNLSDAFIPTFPQSELDKYSLKADLLAIYNLNPEAIAIVYGNALDVEADLATNAAIRNADLTLAFDNNAAAVTAATTKEKAGKLALYFYTLVTRPSAEQANVGVIKPRPYSRYFSTTDTAEKTARDALKLTQADLQFGKVDAFFLAQKVQTKLIETDLAGTPTIPTKFAEAVKDTGYTGAATPAAKAVFLATYIATAELGLKARFDIEAYFPGLRLGNIVKAKIDESDLKAIDDRVIAEVNFRYDASTLTKFGLTGTPTKAQVAKVVFAEELAQKKIAYFEKLYSMNLVDHLKALGVTEDELQEVNLSYDAVQADPVQWNSDVIGNMLFSARYGAICDFTAVGPCTTGWESPKAAAEIVIPLGLSRKTALAKEYSLLEVLQLAKNYREWNNNTARVTNNLNLLAHSGALGYEAVTTLYFDGNVKTLDNLVTFGVLCSGTLPSAPAGLTVTAGTTEAQVSNGIKVCDYYSNNAYPQFLGKSRADTLFAPRTNVDVLYDSFGKKFKTQFGLALNSVANSVTNGNTANASFTINNFVRAVAQFPFFCAVEENKATTVNCEKQVAGLLTVIAHNTNGFNNAVNAAPTCDTTVFDNTCQNWPDVETLEYNWVMKLVKQAGIATADAAYPAWGAGAIKGPANYLEFFHTYPNTSANKPVFESPKNVADLVTANPEVDFATALFKWFMPNKVNTVEKITEVSDNGAKLSPALPTKYFYVEDSYLTPSFDMWMLGNVGPTTAFDTMFPTALGGLRGILKNLFQADCLSTVVTTGLPIEKTQGFYGTLLNGLYDTANGGTAPTWANADCSAVAAADGTVPIAKWDRFNRKNYYSPVVTTVASDGFAVRNFQGDAGQCFNVHIETPFTIFSKDSYARCVAIKMKSLYGEAPVKEAATNFVAETGFTFQF